GLMPLVFSWLAARSTTQSYTRSLHDALPISDPSRMLPFRKVLMKIWHRRERNYSIPIVYPVIWPIKNWSGRHQKGYWIGVLRNRSEEHTSELQSRENLVCRLLLEQKNDREPT